MAPMTRSSFATPYTVTADSQLSQDWFCTADLLLSDGDDVHPFERPDGSLGLIIVSAGAASIVSPDPTAPNGWSRQALALPPSPVFDESNPVLASLAAATHSDGVVYVAVSYAPPATGEYAAVFVYGALDGTTITSPAEYNVPAQKPFPVGAQSLDVTFGPNGNLGFYAFMEGGRFAWLPVGGQPDVGTTEIDVSSGGLLLETAEGRSVAAIDAKGSLNYENADQHGGLTTTTRGQLLRLDTIQTSAGPRPVVLYADAYVDPAEGVDDTGLFYMDLADVVTVDPSTNRWQVESARLVASVPAYTSAAVLTSGSFWKVATASGGTLSLITQYAPAATGQDPPEAPSGFGDALPFHQDVVTVWTARTADQTVASLVVQDVLGQLTVLRKDPTSGAWTGAPIRLASATAQELTQWRTELIVKDANGVPVPNLAVTISSDEEVGVWQETGHTVLSPAMPAAFTTNVFGRITLSVPATSLSTATLTVAAPELVVSPVFSPDGDVHGFLGGAEPLPHLGKLTPTTLTNATVPDSSGTTRPLSPVLAAMPSTTQGETARAIVNTVTQCIKVGQKAQPGHGDPTHFELDYTGNQPVYSTTTQSRAVLLSDPLSDLKDAAEDFAHAFEEAVHKIAHAAFDYVEDKGYWLGTIVVEFANGVEQTINYAIRDVKSAVSVVAGVLASIGAVLEDVIAWLRALLDGLILEAWATAGVLDSEVLGALGTQVTTVAATLNQSAGNVFTNARNDVDAVFGFVESQFGSVTAKELPATITLPSGGTLDDIGNDLRNVIESAPGSWLLSKFTSAFGSFGFSSDTAIESAAGALASGIGPLISSLESSTTAAAADLVNSLMNDPARVLDDSLPDLLAVLNGIVDAGLATLDASLEAATDFVTAVVPAATKWTEEPISDALGTIGRVLELLGIHPDLTIGKALSLVVAFPAVVVYKVVKDDPSASLLPGEGGLLAATSSEFDYGPFLYCTAAAASAAKAAADVTVDALIAASSAVPPPAQLLSAAGALLVAGLAYPLQRRPDGTVPPPFSTAPRTFKSSIPTLDFIGPDAPAALWAGSFLPIALRLFLATGSRGATAYVPAVVATLNSVWGATLLVFQTLVAVAQENAGKTAVIQKAVSVSAPLPTATSFLVIPAVVDSSEGYSLAAKVVIDSSVGFIAAMAYLGLADAG